MIEVITFDLWDTVFIDDSDEVIRKASGLDTKHVERRNIIQRFLEPSAPISREHVNLAYDTVDAAFRHVWYQLGVTWTVKERLGILLKGLNRSVTDEDLREMTRLHEEMELDIMPVLAEGIQDAIRQLHKNYKLAVISDAIFSPGRVLRKILEKYQLLQFFDAFVFSDEIGCAKPDPRVFHQISEQLKVNPDRIVHIGDREEKDVEGPHQVGAKAILTTVVKDRGRDQTRAEAVCNDYKQLAGIISTLS